jgi:hypothetical protein
MTTTVGGFWYAEYGPDGTPAPVHGHRVELAGRDDRQHEVQWYDPQAGEWGSVERVNAVDGVLSIPLPSFSRDIAARIRLLVE